jgi:predicted metalloprotease with PDZ domain
MILTATRRLALRLTGALLLGAPLAALPLPLHGQAPRPGEPAVHYEVAFPNADHHEAEIVVEYRGLPDGPLHLRMSRTSPGRYALHEFAKNVYEVRATDGAGRPLPLLRSDPHQWDVLEHDGTVRVRYTLFGDRADGTYAGIDNTQAHLNIPASFMWARDTDAFPVTIRLHPPEDSGWDIATQLVPTDDPHVFTAPSLAYFLDSPIRLSRMTWREWQVESLGSTYTIRLALSHDGTDAEADEYAALARRVVDEQHGIFGELPVFDHGTYTFIAAYLPHVAGDGMEHRNSTILTSTTPLRAGMLSQLGTLSHEFIHVWNVERLRPASLEPFNFEGAMISGDLWFAEGFTSYYQNLSIRRAGITDDAHYAGVLTTMLNAVINGRGRNYFSPIEMSAQAPLVDAAVAVDPHNRANTFISYYTWGAAIGLGLDLTLRTRFPGVSLDDYMRALWAHRGRDEVPYDIYNLHAVLAEVTDDPDFATEFFRRYILGREVVDYAELLARAGFVLRRAAPDAATLGPLPLQVADGRVTVTGATLINTPWYDAGVDRGDRIIAIDDVAIDTAERLAELAAARRPGDIVALSYEKRGERRIVPIRYVQAEQLEVVPVDTAGEPVTESVRALRDAWLGSRAGDRR